MDVGFVFDSAPEIQHDAICLLKRDTDLSFTPALCTQSHAMIFGENYDALKNLLVLYRGCVDCIYIDPPYNTESTKQDGNDYKSKENISGKFGYRDKFMRTGWLNMLNERLKLAKDLLSPKGVIFISIDDSEQAYLKVLCDEIFGEGNFVGDFIRKTKSTINDAKIGVNYQHEFLLGYAKNKISVNLRGGQKDLSHYTNPDNDPNGAWAADNPSAKSGNLKTGYFGVTNPYTGKIDYPPTGMFWRFSEKTLQKHIESGRICFKKEHAPHKWGFIYKRYLSDLKSTQKTFDSLAFVDNAYMNQAATKELLDLGMAESFNYPKSAAFIQKILLHATSPNSLILDFYAGSGTTGQAVMELNREDGGNRRCILVTSNENNIAKGVMYERIYRICHGVGTKNETFGWTKRNEPFKDQGWEVFKMDRQSLKIDDQQKAENLAKQAEKSFKILRPGFTFESDFDLYHSLSSLKPYK
ncbi:site-specific DNA-methyltransferase [Helicobacter suis]|uniref:site-specific DNA-methyltransferase n=1 Tax=Helicobacter suis TaxID=104628 RepID=UPI0007DB5E5D|nr:site-specific DNA-methyltransferase [Helicobacter suis]